MESKNLLIGFAILYVTTGVAIGKRFLCKKLITKNIGLQFLRFNVGVGLYYAGYNAEHPKETPPAKLDVFQDLQDEIKAGNISDFLE